MTSLRCEVGFLRVASRQCRHFVLSASAQKKLQCRTADWSERFCANRTSSGRSQKKLRFLCVERRAYVTWQTPCWIATRTVHCSFFTGRLLWQPAGIKFTQCVSGQKSAFSPRQEKLCVESKNDCHLLELSRCSLSACKVWGDRTTRAGCRSENRCFFCMSRLVCLRVGDIVQTSIVWRFMGRFWCGFLPLFGMDRSFRCTT